MALNLTPVPTRSLDGTTVYFSDYTGIYDSTLNPGGYNGPNTVVGSVTATRFSLSSYLQQLKATTSTVIVSNTEYVVGGTGSFSYDTKTYSAGDTFISMLDGTPSLGTCTLTQTGNYSPVITFVPSQVQTNNLTPSLFGINQLTFPDSTYSVLHEIYTTKYINGDNVLAGTYICGGNPGDLCTLNGITYRVGEKFTIGSTYALTATGSGFVSLYNASTVDFNGNTSPHYFLMNFNAFTAVQQLQLFIAQNKCHCDSNACETLCLVSDYMQAINSNFEDNLGLDISGTQTLLDKVVELIQTEFNLINVNGPALP